MSFSEKIKDEILMTKNKKCCILPLRYGELITESKDLKISEITSIVNQKCCKKSFLKGVFLGSGCIIDPKTDYHFEVSVKTKAYSDYVVKVIKEFGLLPKQIKRNNSHIVYIKDSEQIATILAILEANKAVMEFENVRISKSISNEINRTTNCETANLTKTIEASVKQVNAINKLKAKHKFNDLNDRLREVANLRLKFPEDSLEELAMKCSYKISKSGVYHRLNKIIKISEEI